MSTGLPVIGTDVGDTAEVIGPCGVVVPPRDRARLALAILEVAALPLADRVALGEAARDRIRTRFSIEHVAAQYARLYREIIGERRAEGERRGEGAGAAREDSSATRVAEATV